MRSLVIVSIYRKKGVVEEVRNSFTGVVKMIETGDKIKIDQAHLETAIGMPTAVPFMYACFHNIVVITISRTKTIKLHCQSIIQCNQTESH